MNFDEFKEQYRKVSDINGIVVTDDELSKLFIAQVVVANYQQKAMEMEKKKIRRSVK